MYERWRNSECQNEAWNVSQQQSMQNQQSSPMRPLPPYEQRIFNTNNTINDIY